MQSCIFTLCRYMDWQHGLVNDIGGNASSMETEVFTNNQQYKTIYTSFIHSSYSIHTFAMLYLYIIHTDHTIDHS